MKKLTPAKISIGVIEIVGFVALIAIVIMMMLTTTDVILRYLFDSPILGSMEMTELLMVSVAGLSLAWCTLKSGHIRVDIIINMFSKKTNRTIDMVNYILTAGICAFIVPALINRYIEGEKLDVRTYVLQIPEGPFVLLLSFGYLLTFLVLIVNIVKSISGEKK
ncbi:MAG: TRAP transporter small permease [Thermoplasmata archaeon]|nr:MAG: TRAP transporter small permease [Thermoplasmata archaeon]